VVGPWRVVGWASRGVHGAVYRAVRVGHEQAEPVALKLALFPKDPRFAREVALLSGMRHPSVPRLVDHGVWQHPFGSLHPYKGDNILVRSSDGRAMLTDFGSGTYPGAAPLTPPGHLPSTPVYLSPEAAVLEVNSLINPAARHASSPADDLYALGVTACRMLTGEYPEPAEPVQDEHGSWHLTTVIVPRALAQVEPPLRAFIVRLLSVPPEKRGTAAQLARELEQLAEPCVRDSPEPRVAEPPRAARRRWLKATAAILALASWVWWLTPGAPAEKLPVAHRVDGSASQQDGGTSGLGEAASTASVEEAPPLFFQEGMAEDPLPEPVEGQATPDAKGRCPRKGQVVLNEACWAPLKGNREECEDLSGQIYKDRCYMPVFPAGRRQPTSHPTRKK
jgi:hypothetical protein